MFEIFDVCGWLFVVSFDSSVKTNIIICEALSQRGMNTVNSVSKRHFCEKRQLLF